MLFYDSGEQTPYSLPMGAHNATREHAHASSWPSGANGVDAYRRVAGSGGSTKTSAGGRIRRQCRAYRDPARSSQGTSCRVASGGSFATPVSGRTGGQLPSASEISAMALRRGVSIGTAPLRPRVIRRTGGDLRISNDIAGDVIQGLEKSVRIEPAGICWAIWTRHCSFTNADE